MLCIVSVYTFSASGAGDEVGFVVGFVVGSGSDGPQAASVTPTASSITIRMMAALLIVFPSILFLLCSFIGQS
jgi:hypothetical protein